MNVQFLCVFLWFGHRPVKCKVPEPVVTGCRINRTRMQVVLKLCAPGFQPKLDANIKIKVQGLFQLLSSVILFPDTGS